MLVLLCWYSRTCAAHGCALSQRARWRHAAGGTAEAASGLLVACEELLIGVRLLRRLRRDGMVHGGFVASLGNLSGLRSGFGLRSC